MTMPAAPKDDWEAKNPPTNTEADYRFKHTDQNLVADNINWLRTNKYEKPATGIPKTDMTAAVQTSLGKADTAIQTLPASTGIPFNTVDAKGDLIVGTGADTVARLAAGTGFEIMRADPTASTGIRWAAQLFIVPGPVDDSSFAGTSGTPPNGTMALDTASSPPRLYVRANGGWSYTALGVTTTPPSTTGPSPAYWSTWSAGPPAVDTYFPIMAWAMYLPFSGGITNHAGTTFTTLGDALADCGVNTILGSYTWFDTEPEQAKPIADAARDAGLLLIPSKGWDWYLADNPGDADLIIGWHTVDEPDMSRATYHDANSAWAVNNLYLTAKAADPTRPISANYGKAITNWFTTSGPGGGRTFGLNPGSGYDTGTEFGDLQLYLSHDFASADCYWWVDPIETQTGAWMYGQQIDATRYLSPDPAQPIWGMIENSRAWPDEAIGVTPDQIEQAIWSMLIHGARGYTYFCHDFGPTSATGSLGLWYATYYDTTLAANVIARMKTVNARVTGLAPVLNSEQLGTISSTTGRESAAAFVTVSSTGGIPIDLMYREYGGNAYIFAQASGDISHQASGSTTGTFTYVAGGTSSVTVRDESRTVSMTGGSFTDTFTAYAEHIYVIPL